MLNGSETRLFDSYITEYLQSCNKCLSRFAIISLAKREQRPVDDNSALAI